MDWSDSDLSEAMSLFKQKMSLYLEDEEITNDAAKARKISIGVCDEGLRRLNASGLSATDKKKSDKLWKFFEDQLKLNVNFRIHRLQLMQFRQKAGESIDDFVSRARTLGLKCQFTDEDLTERVIELIIASTPHEPFRNWLYSKAVGTPLDDILTEGRKFEAFAAGNTQLQQLSTQQTDAINAVSHNNQASRGRRPCPNCDLVHQPRKCPAYYDECAACGSKGHWEKCCRKTRKGQRSQSRRGRQRPTSRNRNMSRHRRNNGQKQNRDPRREPQVDVLNQEDDSPNENFYSKQFSAITINTVRSEAFVTLKIKPPDLTDNDHLLKLKVDTGASGNTLPLHTFRQMYGNSPAELRRLTSANDVTLTSYSGNIIPCLGTIVIPCQHKTSHWLPAQFYVVDVTGPPILGLPSSEELKIVSIHIDVLNRHTNKSNNRIQSVDHLKQTYPNQFDTIGNFPGKAKLLLKDDAEPSIDAPRKCSIHIKDTLKAELDKLVECKVLRKVEEHTDWCSSLAFSIKKDGSMRICLDPQKLNDSLKRCPHRIPTVEELNPQFAGAQFFSKLDAKAGYWSVHLEEESQLLTTFRTPFGRYCWRRLPFGLCVSQDIFQARMDDILENLTGVISIADDVAVVGRTEEEHDQNLHNLMLRAAEKGLVFNSKKCAIKQKSITFFGNIYSCNGVQPDPSKIRDIQNMPEPTNKDDIQRFMGMLNYLAPYIPRLAESAYPLRDLLKKDVPWTWDENYSKCYQDLKSMITTEACLIYYDAKETLSLEVDASQKGLGVALVQNDKPIAFGSKTLTECQSRYSNIEREMLAIVHGIQRYHTYLFGKPFIVVTDHKPLVTICSKPIHTAPPRLQRMLLKIQGYQYTITYRPGPQMVMADVLSRLPNPDNNAPVKLDEHVDCLNIAMINFSPEKQDQLRHETAKDPALCFLRDVIIRGWPDKIKELQPSIRAYWSYRDELSVESGIVVKGRQVIIPESLKNDILRQLHNGHQGIEKTRRLARDCVYWNNINLDIEKLCKSCTTCAKHQDGNPKEPLTPHETPTKPWQYLASDLFEANGKHYLLIVDRYTKFPIMEELSTPASSKQIADRMRLYMSLFGRPEEVMTDNGPQYTGQAFKRLLHDWSVRHITSSPHYPRSNGFIERHVRTIKATVKKCLEDGEDPHKGLLNIRATPLDSELPSPAEMMLGRSIATMLPSRGEPGKEEHRKHLQKRNSIMKEHHDKSAKSHLPPMHPGQRVRIRNTDSNMWQPGIVLRLADNNSYVVETWNGAIVRRARMHLKDATGADTPKHVRFSIPTTQSRQTTRMAPPNLNTQQEPETNQAQENATNPDDRRTRRGRPIRRPKRFQDCG